MKPASNQARKRDHIYRLFFLIMAFLAGSVSGSENPGDPVRPNNPLGSEIGLQIDETVKPYLDFNSFSGVILVAKGSNVIFEKGYGMADVERSTPISANTKFQIGSLTKSFTAAAILLLAERGKLTLEDPVSKFVSDFPDGKNITVRHLLEHRSGLPRIVFFKDFRTRSQQSLSTKELISWFAPKPRRTKPGGKYGYSNANYSLLSYIIELSSGKSYGNFVETNILSPLSLAGTGNRTSDRQIADLANGLVPVGIRKLQPSREFDYSVFKGSGSMYSTAGDLFRWYDARRKGRLLKPETQSLIERIAGSRLGHGWNAEKRLGRDAVVMRGWDGVGFSAQLVGFGKEDTTVVVLANLNMSAISGIIADSVAAIALDDKSKSSRFVSVQPNAETARKYAGLYKFGEDFYVPNSTIRFAESGGELIVPGSKFAPEGGLIPVGKDSFIHRQQWIRVRFITDGSGTVSGITYGRFKAKKVVE